VVSFYHLPRLRAWLAGHLARVATELSTGELVVGVVGSVAGDTEAGVFPLIATLIRDCLRASRLTGVIHACAVHASFFHNGLR
jgi:hypothetical protein